MSSLSGLTWKHFFYVWFCFRPHVPSNTKKTLCFSLFLSRSFVVFLFFYHISTHRHKVQFNSNQHADFDSWSGTEESEEDFGRYTFFFWSPASLFQISSDPFDPSFASPASPLISFNFICCCCVSQTEGFDFSLEEISVSLCCSRTQTYSLSLFSVWQ